MNFVQLCTNIFDGSNFAIRMLARFLIVNFGDTNYGPAVEFKHCEVFGLGQLNSRTFFIRAVMSASSFSPPPPTSLVAQPS